MTTCAGIFFYSFIFTKRTWILSILSKSVFQASKCRMILKIPRIREGQASNSKLVCEAVASGS